MHIIYEPRGRAREYSELALNDYIGCENACTYCLRPDTPILMYDGSVKPISMVEIGDEVVGVEEGEDSIYRRYCKSIVTNKWNTKSIGYKITLSDGGEVICSGNHKWLTNRRWKSTIPQELDKSMLTKNNLIMGLGLRLTSTQIQSIEYKKGYLSGIIRGDATLGIYKYTKDSNYGKEETLYRFRLALKEQEAIERTYEFLYAFGVKTSYFDFPMKDRKDGIVKKYKAIRTSKGKDYKAIQDIIKWDDSTEYRRGFLAGIYDAEGSNYNCTGSCRICNADSTIIDFICSSLDKFGFSYSIEETRHTKDKRMIRNVRLLGGTEERVRLFAFCNPSIEKLTTLCGSAVKSNKIRVNNRIENVECIGEQIDLIDITTTTSNFIANGLISHNCFAPSVMRSDREAYHQIVKPRTEAIYKWFEKDCIEMEKNGDTRRVHMNFVSDPYPELEKELHLTRYCIETAMKHGVKINILTKGRFATVLEDMDLFAEADVHFGVTCSFSRDETREEWEPNASSVMERMDLLKEAKRRGVFTWVSMEPVIIPEQALTFFEYMQTRGYVDLWKVGKLNYHPEAQKVDWVKFREDFKALADRLGAKYIIKKDLLEAK